MGSGFSESHRGGEGPPLLLVHGFTDTCRTWELSAPAPERTHEVLAPTLAGHAGAAVRYREEWLPHADWVVLDGVGHVPQLDVPLETAELIAGAAVR